MSSPSRRSPIASWSRSSNGAERALVSLHAHEILMGLVVDPDAPEITGASVALECSERPGETAGRPRHRRGQPHRPRAGPSRIDGPPCSPRRPHVPPTARARRARRRGRAPSRGATPPGAMGPRAVGPRRVGDRGTNDARRPAPDPTTSATCARELRMVFLRRGRGDAPTRHREVDPLPGTFRSPTPECRSPFAAPGWPTRPSAPAAASARPGYAPHGRSAAGVRARRHDPSPDLAPSSGDSPALSPRPAARSRISRSSPERPASPTVVGVRDAVARSTRVRAHVDGMSGQITGRRPPG